jgi:uncharacterized protein YodC (DUF2158 family)
MGIEENHDVTLIAAGRVLGCFLGRVFGHWNSRGDLLVVLPSCARLSLQIRLRSAKKYDVSTKTLLPLFSKILDSINTLRVSGGTRMVRTGYEEEEQRAGAECQWFSRFPKDVASQQASSSETFLYWN